MLTGMPVSPIDVDLVVRAAWLYYEDGLTQAQVAARLFVSRQTVGRLLESARQHGIVRIELDPAYLAAMRLATTVRDVFGLRDAIVVPTATGRLSQERTNERVAAALAAYARRFLHPGAVVGVSLQHVDRLLDQAQSRVARDSSFGPV